MTVHPLSIPMPSAEPMTAWVSPDMNDRHVSDKVCDIVRKPSPRLWFAVVAIGLLGTMLMLAAIAWLIARGVGIWGIQIPVAWGFAIINFVWWIGIGHAGTLISAVLYLLRQRWRNSINRFAEAMTLFAVAIAGMFPLLHLGRPTYFYWLLPYPNTMALWPQWRSPLVWDVFAVATYATVSLLFWYLGLVPDLATLRATAAKKSTRKIAGVLSLGWRGSSRHWQRHQALYLLMAGLATPLVVSVHSIVGLDFATAVVAGWHHTLFPPYFVAGAIFSGMAMVVTLVIPVRAIYGLQDLITIRHFDNMAKVMLMTGMIVTYGYAMEFFIAWYSGEAAERSHLIHMFTGPYASATIIMLACNVLVPQFLWFPKIRRSILPLFIISILINVGMWTERYVIVVASLYKGFMLSASDIYAATFWDWALFVGTLGFFLLLMMMFIRYVPAISMYEVREMLHEGDAGQGRDKHTGTHAQTPCVADGQAIYGVTGLFTSENEIREGIQKAQNAGFDQLEAYTPRPIPGLSAAMNYKPTWVAAIVLAGGLVGACGGYFMQWYAATQSYPWIIAGRPYHSWPSFIPLTFELGVLVASLTGFVVVLALNGLPRPHHPIMHSRDFDRAMRDHLMLCIERPTDDDFDTDRAINVLEDAGAISVCKVPQ